jgi:hypothetical protein
MPPNHYIRSYPSFPSVIPVHTASSLRVTHPSAMIPSPRRESSHRLACVKHSVSVHPEPGSNSSFNIYFFHYLNLFFTWRLLLLLFSLSLCQLIFLVDKKYIIKSPKFCQRFFLFFLYFFLLISESLYLQGLLKLQKIRFRSWSMAFSLLYFKLLF